MNFKELKELNLYNNDISDIKVLEKVKFEKLEILKLSWNYISNYNILKNVTNISFMLFNCLSLKHLPDISKWVISNVKYKEYIFNNISDIK